MVSSLIIVFHMQQLIDALSKQELQTNMLVVPVIFVFIYLISTVIYQFVFRRMQIKGRNELLIFFYKKLQEKPLAFFSKHNSGEIISLANNEVREVGNWASYGVLGLANLTTYLILILAMMSYYSLSLTFVIIGIIVVLYFSTKHLAARMATLAAESHGITAKINSFLLQTLKLETIIHTLNTNDWFVKRFSSLIYHKQYPIDKKRMEIYAVYMSLFLFLSVLLPVVVVIIGSFMSISNDNLTVGILIAFFALTAQLQEPVQIIPDFIAQRKNALNLSERLVPILEEIIDEPIDCEPFTGKIEKVLVDIDHFVYSNDDKKLLSGVNFSLDKNDILLIKGNSGIGKSTLVRLLMGIIKSDTTNILFNNIDSTDILNKIRWKQMLLVEQDSILLEGSLLDNLLLGDIFSEELINEVLFVTCLDDLAKNKEHIIGGDVDGVSGGQKQRINLARVLLRKPDVLILDEPTSSLDDETSARVTSRLVDFASKNNMIIMVISHRNDFDKYATKTLKI